MTRPTAATLCVLLCAALAGAAASTRPSDASLLPNGDFESVNLAGQPVGWPLKAGASLEGEGGNRFLRLVVPVAGEQVVVFRRVELNPDVRALELSYRARYAGIERGKEKWFDGRIMLNFKDAAGREVKPAPGHPSFNGTSKGWVTKSQQFRVPAGATALELMFTLFNAKAGQLDFDDVSLTVVPLDRIEAAEAAARAKEAARVAALPKPKAKVSVPPADKLPPLLHVDGNQLKDASGRPVWLQGVAVPSLDWSAGGENILKSIEVAVGGWKANCVRLPVKSNFWAGTGPYQRDGGMGYRQTVEDAVNLCAAHGAYLVLDLHEYRAPTAAHAAFWTDAAGRYKNHPAVLFDLLNEPHDVSWDVWQRGGPVTDKPKKPAAAATAAGSAATRAVAAENAELLKAFDSIGMQGLVDAVRATGAKNVVIAGGLDWGYDLSGVLAGHALADPTGNGVVYSSHVYPWKSDWQGKFVAAAAKYPLFLGEVGADAQKMAFIPADRQEDPATWVPDMLGTIQQHRLNWTAWSFHPKASPRAIADWTYEPTPFWGAYVKRALAGERFEAKRMR